MQDNLALDTFEIRALALQLAGLDTSQQLTKGDRAAVERGERLIRLYLMRTSIDRRYMLQEQADALGVSLATVKRWAAGEEYQKVAAFMAPPTRSPMVGEAKAYLTETLLPIALDEARQLLLDPDTRASTKAALIKEVLRVGLDEREAGTEETHRRDAMAFLKEQGLQVGHMQVIVNNVGLAPPEYLEKLRAALPPDDVVEGEASEV